jgi:hypothetical protein
MTRLIATIEATEALAYARRMIERGHRADESGGSFFGAERSRTFARSLFEMMMMTHEGRLDLLALAREGEAMAQEIIGSTIAGLRSRGVDIPGEFIGYEMEVLTGRIPQVSTRGPDKRDFFLRDISIAATVAAVCDRYGLKPTGRPARGRSGCAIVGEALIVTGRGYSAKAVEAIWQRHKRGMPTVRGWALTLEGQP